MNAALAAAEKAIADRIPVMVLKPQSKHPATANGWKDASIDPAQVRAWLANHPNRNIGFMTGTGSGLIVVDFDPENGGYVGINRAPRQVVESECASLLAAMRPAESLIRFADARFRDLWNEQAAAAKTGVKSVEADLRKIDSDIDQLMDRIVAAESNTLITAYERKIHALEEKRVQLLESVAAGGKPLADYDTTFRTALEFANPCILWNSPRLEDKRAVLKLASRIAYSTCAVKALERR